MNISAVVEEVQAGTPVAQEVSPFAVSSAIHPATLDRLFQDISVRIGTWDITLDDQISALDLGCGNGTMLSSLQSITSWEVMGLDIQNLSHTWTQDAIVTQAYAHHIPFKSGSLDIVTAFALFNYVESDMAAKIVYEVYRVLREEGLFIIGPLKAGSDSVIRVYQKGRSDCVLSMLKR